MDFTQLKVDAETWLKRAKRAHDAAVRRAEKRFQQDIAGFANELAAYRAELEAAPIEQKATQETARQAFEALPGAREFRDARNRGGNPGGELQEPYQAYAARSRAATIRRDERDAAARAAFAPYKEHLDVAEGTLNAAKHRAQAKFSTETQFVNSVIGAIESRERVLGLLVK